MFEMLSFELGFYVASGLLALLAIVATVLYILRRRRMRNCTRWITMLAADNNWGEITIMSSRNNKPTVYKTWIGRGDPQDLAKRATR
jgi:hypothetical protein